MALLVLSAAAPADRPESYKVDENYVAVRVDVLSVMNVAEDNLAKCELALDGAQEDLQEQAGEIEALRTAAAELGRQKAALAAHVTILEQALARGPTVSSEIAQSLEAMDEELACAGCWALGTLQCVGLAWVFNQADFRR
jgi:hypothetical protein